MAFTGKFVYYILKICILQIVDWSILDKAKPTSPSSKKYMLCLTEKYHIILSTKNLLNKRNELVNKF